MNAFRSFWDRCLMYLVFGAAMCLVGTAWIAFMIGLWKIIYRMLVTP